jgi:hypothetical protein
MVLSISFLGKTASDLSVELCGKNIYKGRQMNSLSLDVRTCQTSSALDIGILPTCKFFRRRVRARPSRPTVDGGSKLFSTGRKK